MPAWVITSVKSPLYRETFYCFSALTALVQEFRAPGNGMSGHSWRIGLVQRGTVGQKTTTDLCLDRLFWATQMFLILFFLIFFASGRCARLSWPYPVSFWAHVNLPQRIVSYDQRHENWLDIGLGDTVIGWTSEHVDKRRHSEQLDTERDTAIAGRKRGRMWTTPPSRKVRRAGSYQRTQ